MPPPRILVVDDDAWILRMVTTVLEKRGYELVTAADGEEGFHKAVQRTPDLVITDVMMPKMDGWTLVKALRSKPEFAFVPMIFLTALGSDEDRIRGFRLGADDYLPKPFRFEELDLRVANALRRRQQMEASTIAQARGAQPPVRGSAQAGAGIQGTLDQIGLSSLLTILEMERKSGVLVLARAGGGETGRIFLREGRIVRARMDGRPTPKNEAAVYHMLSWPEGKFEFSALEVDMEDEVKTSTTHILMEGARRIDEAAGPK
jgi:DNA-binding response OmpR family regulator